jgi:hypothetical protein
MTKEQFLCVATGTNSAGEDEQLQVYYLGSNVIKVYYGDGGYNRLSHRLPKMDEPDICREVGTLYGLVDVHLDGDIGEGLFAASWPTSRTSCQNCGCQPTRRAYGSRGYCGLCLSMIDAAVALRAWNRQDPTTARGLPRSAISGATDGYFSDDEFEIWRQDHISQAEVRLADLHSREQKRQGLAEVTGTALQEKLAVILRFVRRKAQFPPRANDIDAGFDQEQRRFLFTLLDRIEDEIPWRGFNSQHAWDLIHEHKQRTHRSQANVSRRSGI